MGVVSHARARSLIALSVLLAAFPTGAQANTISFGDGDSVNPCSEGDPIYIGDGDTQLRVTTLDCDPGPVVETLTAFEKNTEAQAAATLAAVQAVLAQQIERAQEQAEEATKPFLETAPDPDPAEILSDVVPEGPCGLPACPPPACGDDCSPIEIGDPCCPEPGGDPCDGLGFNGFCAEPPPPPTDPHECDGVTAMLLCIEPPCDEPPCGIEPLECDAVSTERPCLGPESPCEDLSCTPRPPCIDAPCCADVFTLSLCTHDPFPCMTCVPECEALAGPFCEMGPDDADVACVMGPCERNGCIAPVGCEAYTPEGNLICSTVEQIIGTDTDRDGVKDCEDADDDDDGLSDEVEGELFDRGDARLVADLDADAITDGRDMLPLSPLPELPIQVSIARYYRTGEECDWEDWNGDMSDPYITAWVLSGLPLGSVALDVPNGWSKSDHIHNRTDSEAVDARSQRVQVSTDIVDWHPDFWTIPRLAVDVGLFDHDILWDTPIDLAPSYEVDSYPALHALTEVSGTIATLQGAAPCRATLQIAMAEEFDAIMVYKSVADMSKVTPVLTKDLEGGNFR